MLPRNAALLFLLASTVLFAEDAYVVERNAAVPMRDGIALATDLYFPAAGGVKKPGPFPAILTRTPYDKARAESAIYGARDESCPTSDRQLAASRQRRGGP